jgi:phenylpyruvate tautomerase
MPLIHCQTNRGVEPAEKQAVLLALSEAVARETGKPEQYMMATLGDCAMVLDRSDDPAAYVDLRAIGGLGPEVNKRLSKAICEVFARELGISAGRVYITFSSYPADHWGWNGTTFG